MKIINQKNAYENNNFNVTYENVFFNFMNTDTINNTDTILTESISSSTASNLLKT